MNHASVIELIVIAVSASALVSLAGGVLWLLADRAIRDLDAFPALRPGPTRPRAGESPAPQEGE